MAEKIYGRRSILKRGLMLVGGVASVGAMGQAFAACSDGQDFSPVLPPNSLPPEVLESTFLNLGSDPALATELKAKHYGYECPNAVIETALELGATLNPPTGEDFVLRLQAPLPSSPDGTVQPASLVIAYYKGVALIDDASGCQVPVSEYFDTLRFIDIGGGPQIDNFGGGITPSPTQAIQPAFNQDGQHLLMYPGPGEGMAAWIVGPGDVGGAIEDVQQFLFQSMSNFGPRCLLSQFTEDIISGVARERFLPYADEILEPAPISRITKSECLFVRPGGTPTTTEVRPLRRN